MVAAATDLANRQTVLLGGDLEDLTDDVDSMSWKMVTIWLAIGLAITVTGAEAILAFYVRALWAIRIMTPANSDVLPPTLSSDIDWVETDI